MRSGSSASVLMLSKALVVGAYQKKAEEIARFEDVDLTVVVPPAWGNTPLERAHTKGYNLVVSDIAFNGNFHLHYYPKLKQIVAQTQPDIIHIDEEPYNLATFQAMKLAQKIGAKTLVFTWQNLKRRYPPPFSWLEKYVLRHTDALLVGNAGAAEVWPAKGYRGLMRQIPQFGVDPNIFYRHQRVKRVSKPGVVLRRSARRPSQPTLSIGYVGRLVPEKGIDLLLEAAAKLKGPWEMKILGSGPDRSRLEKMAQWLGLGNNRISFDQQIPSTHMPNYLSGLDALVLPSLTQSNWKEQFGRVLIEAMACEVVTVGARSGAIPEVIGQAGLLFDEGNSEDLAAQLQRLLDDVPLRQKLRQAGRQRVLNNYTHAAIARHTVEVYKQIYSPASLPESSI